MSCCGLWKRMGCNRTELITVKMALFAPMPRARARIETQAKPGLRARVRAAYLRSRRAELNMLHILIGAKIKVSNASVHRTASDPGGSMKKLILQGIVAALLAPLSFAVEAVSAVHGTISKIDSSAKTIVVKTADGAEHTFRFVAKTTVHGTEA